MKLLKLICKLPFLQEQTLPHVFCGLQPLHVQNVFSASTHIHTHTHNAAALNNLRDRIISCKEDALLFYPLHPARHNAIDQPSSLV
jgi:hypothetical protein|eukprot:COSAG01_NODE_1893_length_8976_cov_21.264053_1_plen_86_part_00